MLEENSNTNPLEKINVNQLNECVEVNMKNMNQHVDYEFLKKSAKMMLEKLQLKGDRKQIVLFDKKEAISIVLDFFNSLGEKEWQNKVSNILSGNDEDVSINIFEIDEIEDINATNKDGLRLYSLDSRVEHGKNSKMIIKIALKDELEKKERESLPKDKITLDDLYTIVHEISHSFDFAKDERNRGPREIFGEIVPYCFERMLDKYLIEKNLVSESAVDKMKEKRLNCSIRHARAVWTKLELVELKEKEGALTKNILKEVLQKNGIQNPHYAKEMLEDVIRGEPNINFDARYPIAELTVYNFIELYSKNRKLAVEQLKQYCEEMQKGNADDDVLKLVGCPTNLEEVERTAKNIGDSRNR